MTAGFFVHYIVFVVSVALGCAGVVVFDMSAFFPPKSLLKNPILNLITILLTLDPRSIACTHLPPSHFSQRHFFVINRASNGHQVVGMALSSSGYRNEK